MPAPSLSQGERSFKERLQIRFCITNPQTLVAASELRGNHCHECAQGFSPVFPEAPTPSAGVSGQERKRSQRSIHATVEKKAAWGHKELVAVVSSARKKKKKQSCSCVSREEERLIIHMGERRNAV